MTQDPLQDQIADKTEQVKLDEASAVLSYVGYAISGALTSEAKWLIKRISISGNVTTEE